MRTASRTRPRIEQLEPRDVPAALLAIHGPGLAVAVPLPTITLGPALLPSPTQAAPPAQGLLVRIVREAAAQAHDAASPPATPAAGT
ncbi:MAG: hypothetical protein K2W96_09290, partial [Gemmataceae bacterium]|nr:hypothetical protein [Gemmataceae bacterium]